MSRTLSYASPPPADRADVVRQGCGFDITLPPQRRIALGKLLLALSPGLVLVLYVVMEAALLGGAPRLSVIPGTLFFAFAVWLIVRFVGQSRACARITLYDGVLTIAVPALLRQWVLRCDFRVIDGARVAVGPGKATEWNCFYLLGRRGGWQAVTPLNDYVYRREDLRAVVDALRESIRLSEGGL